MNEIVLDGQNLTIAEVVAVAYGKPNEPRIVLSTEAEQNVVRVANAVQTLLERGEIAYGITTGFGAFKNKIINRADVETLQRNILLSHAVGVGKPFDVPTTRAILLIRANTLARGYSGVRLETLRLLLEFLNRGVHPVIPEKGSLGASGDLAPLAHAALPLIGEGSAEFGDAIMSGAQALERAGLKPLTLAAKEGLALTNGTAVMCAVGVLASHKSQQLKETADIAACLSLEALNGTTDAFDERLHALRPHPRQQKCAANLRAILAESDFVRSFDPSNVQDAYSLRCIPQVHGAARDAIDYAEWVFTNELNAVTDNPLIFIDERSEKIEVVSGGNFHGELLALAFDYLAIALSEFGSMSERRIMRLVDESCNDKALPAFLTQNGGLNSGFMLVQYTAVALVAENKVLAHPASVDSIPTSANVEDHVSMGVTAGLKARQILENVETIFALELFAAAQGIDFRREKIGWDKRLGKGTRPVYEQIRQLVPFIETDTFMQPYIESLKAMVANGTAAF
ncbi:MAG: histidine ammonia-lyase [Pyrinomonadaceae bacterium]